MTVGTAPAGMRPRDTRRPLGRMLRREVLVPLATLVAVAAALVLQTTSGGAGTPPHLVPMPRSQAMELRYGIRFSQVAVTAEGGMLDVRYIVLDSETARSVGHAKSTFPIVVDDRTGRELSGLAMSMFPHDPIAGYQYVELYRNDSGTVSTGDTVSIRVGTTWLRGITVR